MTKCTLYLSIHLIIPLLCLLYCTLVTGSYRSVLIIAAAADRPTHVTYQCKLGTKYGNNISNRLYVDYRRMVSADIKAVLDNDIISRMAYIYDRVRDHVEVAPRMTMAMAAAA